MSQMQTPSLMVAMNQLSNHDHSRFLTRTNQTVGRIGTVGAEMASVGIKKGVFREAVLIREPPLCIMGMRRGSVDGRIRITAGLIPGDRRTMN